ncbi:murein hydrolase activator EnvC family protein [Azospirillum halopraeferens]|uniref:murein hydrolase activator EnvC family protein n=1 Tax=Azospirillum halopraeferens TaxID=34010 RepID=UPI000423F544|nr:peptidoglycan DD-metalloendopeptidase family protein [Azospirillum halopraeferens]
MAQAGRGDPHGRARHRAAWPLLPVPSVLATLPVLAVLAAAPAGAAPEDAPDRALMRVEQEIEADAARRRFLDRQSEAIEAELEELRRTLVALADEARTREGELSELEESLQALEDEERDRADRLDMERQQIARLLAALQRLSRIPPEVAIARPDGPVDTLRSALMLRDAVPVLRARADALAGALRRLADVRERLEEQRTHARAARDALAGRRAEIARLVSRREELSRRTEEERREVARRMERLSVQAGDLRQLMDRVEAERRAAMEAAARREAERLTAERRAAEAAERAAAARRLAEAAEDKRRREADAKAAEAAAVERRAAEAAAVERRAAETAAADLRAAESRAAVATAPAAPDLPPATLSAGGLRQPVGGPVVTRYGEADRYGSPSRGLTIRARAGSAVVAPSAGVVMFAGPFRNYGQILIVEHGNGYHSLIAGLGRIDTAVGNKVAAGEPIGLVPGAGDDAPELYYELRRHGQPINPQRGFGAPEGKGQG